MTCGDDSGAFFLGLDVPTAPARCHYSEGFLIDTGRPRAIELDPERETTATGR